MNRLVDEMGNIRFGLFDEPVEMVNYLDYPLETPLGYKLPLWMRRIKANQFCFVGISGEEYMIGMAVVDLHTVTNGFFYVYDRAAGEVRETSSLSLPGKEIFIDPTPDRVKARFRKGKLLVDLDSGRIDAKGKGISLNAEMELDRINPLRICTRTGYRGWVYVQKINPVKIRGELSIEGKTVPVSSPGYMGSVDWTAGYMRRKTWWNWSSISASIPDGRALGLNLSCGVNETGFTENFFVLDGDMTKVDSVYFAFDDHDLFKPWRITSRDSRVDLEFTPEAQRGENVNALLLASRFTQLMGTYNGRLETASGEVVTIRDIPGFAEDHYAKW